jgi:ABC-type Fe3+-hydroxamate transport system substrate-binding protein
LPETLTIACKTPSFVMTDPDHKFPKRIISLVPSQTELLFTLGLDEEVIGITKFCVHPESWFKTKQRIGGTKTINIDAVKALQPDLVIANKEENIKEQVEVLQQITQVYVSDVNTLEDALVMITEIGALVNRQDPAVELVNKIQSEFEQLTPLSTPIKTAYLIWKDPYMAAGGDTFISDLLCRCGFKNTFKDVKRYPEVLIKSVSDSSGITYEPYLSPAELSDENCDLLLLSSEPYPFKQKHLTELQEKLPGCKILLVDGEMFSWYGSRLLASAQYLKQLVAEVRGISVI